MDTIASYQPLLWISALLFLLTAGYLIANLGAAVALFARRGPQHGHLQADTRGRRRQASRSAVTVALALHVASIAGIAYAVLAATVETTDTAPGREGLPAELEPLPDL
jgi:hypothetical protein